MRIETVTEYVAEDGTRFRSEDKCRAYEKELAEVARIMAVLPARKIDHGKYVQHDRETLMQVKRALWGMVLEAYGDYYPKWRDWDADSVHPMGIVGRVLSESDGALAAAWTRLCRINFDLGREYDQAYFAMHPDRADTPQEEPTAS